MKPMSLNLSKMKKISGDKNSSTFAHPDGHQIVIAHHGLKPLQRQQLIRMPVAMDVGGSVPDFNQDSSSAPNEDAGDTIADQAKNTPNPQLQNLQNYYESGKHGSGGLAGSSSDFAQSDLNKLNDLSSQDPKELSQSQLADLRDLQKKSAGTPGGSSASWDNRSPADESGTGAEDSADQDASDTAQINPNAPSPQDPNQPNPSNSQPSGSGSVPAGMQDYSKVYNQGLNAINEQQKVNQALSKANLDVQTKNLMDRQALNKQYQDHYQTFAQHQKDLMDDYMNNHIDQNHYKNNLSGGQKAGAGIGMILSGMGSARTGQPNLAYEAFQKNIDRDIDSQKSRMNQQKTILGANQDLYHDDVLATNQTRINMNDIYSRQLEIEANKQGTPQAKANADWARYQLGKDNQGLLMQNAIRSTVLNKLKQGGQGINAIDLGNAGFIPKEQAAKEQASINQAKAALEQSNRLFDMLDKEQQYGNVANPQSYSRVKQIAAQMTPLAIDENPSKRLTPESYEKEVAPFIYGANATKETRLQARQGMANLIKLAHEANYPMTAQYAPAALPQYGNSSNAPAPQTQTRNGVTYQKVPGGWKRVQ